MFFIDGHCDTLSKALDENKKLDTNNLQVSFNEISKNGRWYTSNGKFCRS